MVVLVLTKLMDFNAFAWMDLAAKFATLTLMNALQILVKTELLVMITSTLTLAIVPLVSQEPTAKSMMKIVPCHPA